jgi:excinuclease ABC subunit C
VNLEQYKKKAKRMPDSPGVYFFLGKNKKVLYIGKATSLRDRTRSYFAPDLIDARGPLLVGMLKKALTLNWRETDSVLEALLLEASLVRAHKPKYNTELKDDKSFNYVVVTKEDYPRVLVVRGRELGRQLPYRRSWGRVHLSGGKEAAVPAHVFGPFPHGLQLREAMKLIRKIFPYRDTCRPWQASPVGRTRPRGRPCFNAQLGLCPGVCWGEISKRDYRRNVRHIVLLFEGKKKQLIKALNKEMRAAAKAEEFEQAKELQRQMYALQHIQDISLIKEEYRSLDLARDKSTRIEAYDVAHLRGSAAVGVMTVVEDGVAEKDQYRKFKIKSAKAGDDPGALKEVLSRRLGHDEWPLPRLIVVDGSTAQINTARNVLAEYGMAIPVVGVIKDEKHRPRNISGDRNLVKGKERDILLANTEAHRFAIGYHRKTSRRELTL